MSVVYSVKLIQNIFIVVKLSIWPPPLTRAPNHLPHRAGAVAVIKEPTAEAGSTCTHTRTEVREMAGSRGPNVKGADTPQPHAVDWGTTFTRRDPLTWKTTYRQAITELWVGNHSLSAWIGGAWKPTKRPIWFTCNHWNASWVRKC